MPLVEDAPAATQRPHEHERAEGARMGYANCTYPGCICQAFVGSGDLCLNCTHQYSMHN